jgi:lipoyl-dependent peroxiredoxin
MPEIVRTAHAHWRGDLKTGGGAATSASGALKDVVMTAAARFESAPGSNPEELVAAAHAACFSMALSNILAADGHPPKEVRTRAVLRMALGEGGPRIVSIGLATEGEVAGIDQEAFAAAAAKAKDGCPISKLLKPGLESLTVEATLVS